MIMGQPKHPQHSGPTKTPLTEWANQNTPSTVGQPKHPQHSGSTKTSPAQWANQNRCETISSLLIPGDLFRRPPFSFNSVRIIYVCILIYCILHTHYTDLPQSPKTMYKSQNQSEGEKNLDNFTKIYFRFAKMRQRYKFQLEKIQF